MFKTFGDVMKVYLYDKPHSEDPAPNSSKYFPDRPKVKVMSISYPSIYNLILWSAPLESLVAI